MSKPLNPKVFPGAVFSKLTVIERIPRDNKGIYRIKCRCECGNIVTTVISQVINGRSTSCGCNARAKPDIGYGKVIPNAVFSRLTVICRNKDEKGRFLRTVNCRCSCGSITNSHIDGLLNGNIKSCGCLASEVTAKRNRETAKYGGFSSKFPRTWKRWQSMLQRCFNKKTKSYANYGAKGVIVCKFLRDNPYNLVKIIGPFQKIKHSLDRFPIHNGNYTCGQCDECISNSWKLNIRWATRKDQSNNRGAFNVYITAFGKTLTRGQWQDETGINEWRIHRRINELGWSAEKALTTPDKQGNCYQP